MKGTLLKWNMKVTIRNLTHTTVVNTIIIDVAVIITEIITFN